MFRRFVILAALPIIVCATLFVYGVYSMLEYRNPSNIRLYFPFGTPSMKISRQLYENKVIWDYHVFLLAVKLAHHLGHNIISGEYEFEPNITGWLALEKMLKGQRVARKITIPEGLTAQMIRALVNSAEGLEGTISQELYDCNALPETYFYYYGDYKDGIISSMKHAQKVLLTNIQAWPAPLTNINDVLILASIVEKETGIPEERARVAGVYLNRLKIGMPLQADPTVIYGMSGGLGVLDRPLNRQDLKVDGIFNTYTRAGLPPNPIACPGKASIIAVLKPEEHNYLYFVANGNGGHVFARTLAEHNVNNAQRKLAAQ